ncbi:MFS general substrate transporter [Violaceomyces palustris]|uniref:MFS general substrate transporter n=1 Tax=Violaceomyces palustris TaxID=1673888 RepID=A0ACD0NUV0_9BASI|nr:MFS general substrate transporter [Violaceomyces palustris]
MASVDPSSNPIKEKAESLTSSQGRVASTPGESQGDGNHQVASTITYTREEEKRLVRKIDWLTVPILTALYLLSFLDRSNIGNAKIEGLVTDLGIKDYGALLSIFFVGYVIAEVPSNLVLKLTSPPIWLPTLTLVWGILSVGLGLCKKEVDIYLVRFFLGVAEAGLFPGSVYIFSMFYPRKERHYRVSLLLSGAAASGSLSGILAFGIAKMGGVGGKPGWAWIFILEGLLTIVVSIAAYWIVPNYPNVSKRFTPREKEIISARLSKDSDALDSEAFNWEGVRQAFKDPYVYLYSFLFHGYAFSLYSFSLFLPTIIAGLGYKSWQAQLLTIPPYFLAFLVTMSVAHASFLVGKRLVFIIGSGLVAILGYIVQMTSPTLGGKYVSVFIVASGVYSGNALLLSLPSENISGQTKRATALAMQIAIGDVGAIAGTLLYRIPLGSLKNKNYNVSHGLAILWLGFGILSASLLWFLLGRENRRRDALASRRSAEKGEGDGDATQQETEVLGIDELRRLGDRRPDWRYHV